MIFLPVLLSVVIWVWLLVGHGAFWRSGPVLGAAYPTRPLKVTVVIPARDEAEHIADTLRSLLIQQFNGELKIVMVDDNSSDATGALARELAVTDRRLSVLDGELLKTGWTGKMWAVSQGLRQTETLAADYVLFTDADIVHGPGHLASLVSRAERDQLSLVSEMVRLRCESLAERATLPAFVFFFQLLYPFRWVCDPGRTTAAAAGGTMLVAQEALRRVDGVNRISRALIDDVALAREIKRGGHRIWLGHGEQVISERRYAGFSDAWKMIARTAYVQLGYSPWVLIGTCVGMLLVYVEPVLASLFATGALRWAGAVCWTGMAIAFQPTLWRYRRSPAWGLLLPVIGLFYLMATVSSAVRFYQGRGGQWKNRNYPAHG
jgi:hopene-associated glycosyltransferase HpnB